MKKVWMIAEIVVLIFLLWTVTAFAAEPQQASAGDEADKKGTAAASARPQIALKVPFDSPLFNNFPLAIVNDETITLQDLSSALAASHEDMADMEKKTAKVNYSDTLGRLITIRLIIQEAKSMGLNDLPEIKNPVDTFSKSSVRDLLIEELGKDVKADEGEVEKLYKEVIMEWKIKSVMFRQEDNAKKMEEEIKAGKSFDETAAKALDEGLAEGSKESAYMKPRELHPQIAEVVSKMNVNDVSSLIKIEKSKEDTGYVIVKLEDVRSPDDPAARERARNVILESKKVEAVKDFKKDFIKKYAKINSQLIKKLDFESEKPGIKKLLQDKRVIVEMKGEKPLTVGDLTRALQEKYFHGMDTAIKSRQVNSNKLEMLDQILEKRLFGQEALRRGIDKTEKYKNMMREYEDSLLFGLFVQKALIPDIKVSEEEMKAYYADNVKEFTYPEMMKLDSLVFNRLDDAESSLAKLRQGADFKWMKENAEGQVEKDAEGILSFRGNSLMVTSLPEGIQKALSGVHSGDFRLYESPEGHAYVFYIRELIPSQARPFEGVQGTIFKNIFNKKLNKSVEEWSAKLKEPADIKIYLADPAMEKYNNKAN